MTIHVQCHAQGDLRMRLYVTKLSANLAVAHDGFDESIVFLCDLAIADRLEAAITAFNNAMEGKPNE